jgi:hypothetical protein
MRGAIFRATIGFQLDNNSRDTFTVSRRDHQKLPEQFARDREDIGSRVKLPWELRITVYDHAHKESHLSEPPAVVPISDCRLWIADFKLKDD